MNSENIFQLNLSLETLSTVAVAIYFWELPNVKEKVYNHVLNYNDQTDTQNNQDWDRVVNYATKQVRLCYPEKLLCHIKHLVQILGCKLRYWIEYVIDDLKCDPRYAEKIYWTPNGDIDEFKIVEHWLTNGTDLGVIEHRPKCFLRNPLLCTASAFVQEEFIHNHLEEMKSKIFQYLPVSHRKKDWNDYAVTATWIFFCHQNSKTSAVRLFKSFSNIPNLPADELFLISVTSGLKFAVKYFFHRLSDAEKAELLIKAASTCLQLSSNTDKACYEKRRYREILIFLIFNMDDITKLSYVTENFISLFKQFLYMWPYQEICLILLENNPHYSPGNHNKLLKKMIKDFSYNCCEVKYFGKGIIFNQIFQTLLDITPKEEKKEIFIGGNYKNLKSLKIFNGDILNLVINDSDLKEFRDSMIKIVEAHLKKWVLRGRYDVVSNLIEEQKLNINEKSNPLATFLSSGNLKLAEEYLSWLYVSDSEILAAKKRIDCVTICTNLIKKTRHDLATEYLNWQCDNEEEQENVKKTMILNGVLCDQIYQIWCMHKEPVGPLLTDVKKKCEELLLWFLKSEEAAVEFRKSKLIENDSFIVKYWNNLFFHSSFGCFGEFLEFCFWLPERIEDLREKIANNMEWWIDTYAVEGNRFLMVDSLFKWAFKNNEERKIAIAKYLETSKGALLILKSFKDVNSTSAILQLFNSWMISYDPIHTEIIKMNLSVCNNNILQNNVIIFIESLLNDVKKYGSITSSSVSRKKIKASYHL